MTPSPSAARRFWAALLAATLLNLPLGSVYSFSVLLRPIETELGIPRSALSLVFGLATIGFTAGSVLASFCVEGVGTDRLAGESASDVHGRVESFRQLTSF